MIRYLLYSHCGCIKMCCIISKQHKNKLKRYAFKFKNWNLKIKIVVDFFQIH